MRLFFTVLDTPQTQNGVLLRNFLRQCAVSTDLARAVKFRGSGFFADGEPVLANRRVYPGQTVSFELPPEGEGVAPQPEIPVKVVYEDAFAVVLPDCSLARGRAVAEQLRVAVQGCTFAHRGQSFSLQASLGLVQLAPAWASVSALLHAADMACYAAKRAGRNKVCEATPEDAPK